MSSPRFLANNFPDYDGQDYLSKAQPTYLREDIHQSITSSLAGLLQYWESHLNHFDATDISVYTGVTGAAMLCLKIYQSQLFSNSNDYLQKAANIVEQALKRYRSIRVPTFMCGEVGLLSVAALISAHLGRDYQNYLRQIASVHSSVVNIANQEIPDELLYGRAGYLYAMLFIRQRIAQSAQVLTDDMIRAVVKAIINSGNRTASQVQNGLPLVYFWYQEPYFGAAHGYAGIAYMLLEAHQYLTQQEKTDLVKPIVDFICNLQFPNSGNFPACVGEQEDKLVHWCHGSPGVIHTLVMGYKAFADPKYLQIAAKAADDIWARGLLKKGYGLCHGAAGNAYAFLRLFQLTRDQKYLYRAIKFAEWCGNYGNHGCRTPDTPFSLFEGMAGTLFFLADILRPFEATFPAYQLTT